MTPTTVPELLDRLVELSKCTYISDLHERRYAAQVADAAARIDAGAYSVQEWNDAARYITGAACDFKNVTDASAFLIGWLAENR